MKQQSWRAFIVEAEECPVCGKRFHSVRGQHTHWLACHGDSARAERNWNICMMFYEGGCSTREVAEAFDLPVTTVQRIVANVAQWQHYYELDPMFFDEPKVIPMRRRA